jgi:hypothetical protein
MKPVKPRPNHKALAVAIREAHQQCVHAFRKGLQHAMEAGRLLVEARRKSLTIARKQSVKPWRSEI